ncbi:MAG TPA: HEAT repeat domain-containing protein [Armatimonadota bacterium]
MSPMLHVTRSTQAPGIPFACVPCLILMLLMSACPLKAQVSPWGQADSLRREGKSHEAFLAFLRQTGGEYAAVGLAQTQPQEYLAVLRQASGISAPRRRLVEGELLLRLGRRTDALQSYREAASRVSTTPGRGWAQGLVPVDAYFVEPPVPRDEEDSSFHSFFAGPAEPFVLGPGSHRDNWLVRRFIALGAWEDAGREFQRVWEIHREFTRPYTVKLRVPSSPPGRPATETRTVTPAGFQGQGLQFALDYAYFLKRRGATDRALALLREPLALMDLDRNPNDPHLSDPIPGRSKPLAPGPVVGRPVGPFYRRAWGSAAGISRKEYLRLALGELKRAGKLGEVASDLRHRIASGDNRARRVLAWLLLQEGRPTHALEQELAYLRDARLDTLSLTYRRAVALEELRPPGPRADAQSRRAIQEFERVLELPYTPPRLPDKDEETRERQQQSAAMPTIIDPNTPQGHAAFRAGVYSHLERLYTSLGRTDDALRLSLRSLEGEGQTVNGTQLQEVRRRFGAARKEDLLRQAAAERLPLVEDPLARAGLLWLLEDYDASAREFGRALQASEAPRADLESWKEAFRQAGREPLKALLTRIVEAQPSNGQAWIELLELDDRLSDPEAVLALEGLLASGSGGFLRSKGTSRLGQYLSAEELAYRLMRLYEKGGQEDKLITLGFRVLEAKPPFRGSGSLTGLPGYASYTSHPIETTLRCAWVLLPHLKRPEDLSHIKSISDTSPWISLKRQVGRLLGARELPGPADGHQPTYNRVLVETLSPDGKLLGGGGLSLLTNRDDVRAITPDGTWVGTSWGLVRYREEPGGVLRVTQVPIGERLFALVPRPDALLAVSPHDLYRVEGPSRDRPSVVRVDLRAAVPKDLPLYAFTQSLWWKDALYLATFNRLFRYRPASREVTDLGPSKGGLFAVGDQLWTGLGPLDPATEEVRPLALDARSWECFGTSGEEVWCAVQRHGSEESRPALVDPKTLEVREPPVVDPELTSRWRFGGEYAVLAQAGDQVWLRNGNMGVLEYRRSTGRITVLRPEDRGGEAKHLGPMVLVPGGSWPRRLYLASATQEALRGPALRTEGSGSQQLLEAGPDSLLLGSPIIRRWGEDNLGTDDEDGMSSQVLDQEGGLYRIDRATGDWTKLGSSERELPDFYVKRVVFDDEGHRAYVCTNGGVAILSLPEGALVGRLTLADGLPSNKVEDVARIARRLYLACELGDADGGLAVLDLDTGLLQTLGAADGLTCDKVKALRVEGERLHILYGAVYTPRAPIATGDRWIFEPGDNRVAVSKSSILDTRTGEIRDGDEVLTPKPPAQEQPSVPYLGGIRLVDESHGGKRYLGGTHGLLIAEGAEFSRLPAAGTIVLGGSKSWSTPEPPGWVPAEQAVVRATQTQQWLAEARAAKVPSGPDPSMLPSLLTSPNPYLRAEILSRGMESPAYGVAAEAFVDDPNPRLAATATYLVSKSQAPTAVPALRRALNSPDPQVRGLAALSLAARGEPPRLDLLEEVLRRRDGLGNYPFGAASSVGVLVGPEEAFRSLAPHAGRAVFELLLRYPRSCVECFEVKALLPALGDSLRSHPEAADVLLAVKDGKYGQPGRVRLAAAIFGAAGPKMLPLLHQALESPERVIRSNAARACGAAGSPSSIAPLLRALEMESGLVRASVVSALGELQATRALPRLAKLYVEVRQDEKRRLGAGFRAAQAQSQMGAQYESLSSLAVLGGDWEDLRSVLRPAAREELGGQLLDAGVILEAVRKMGSTPTRGFYHALAADKEPDSRLEAAQRLGEASPGDRGVQVLRNLMADPSEVVRMAAAASLLIANQPVDEREVLRWLRPDGKWMRKRALAELSRVKSADKLAFALPALEAAAKDAALSPECRRLALTAMGKG